MSITINSLASVPEMVISGKIKIWTECNVITLEEQLITVKVGQSIDWRNDDRFRDGIEGPTIVHGSRRTAQGLAGAGTIF